MQKSKWSKNEIVFKKPRKHRYKSYGAHSHLYLYLRIKIPRTCHLKSEKGKSKSFAIKNGSRSLQAMHVHHYQQIQQTCKGHIILL